MIGNKKGRKSGRSMTNTLKIKDRKQISGGFRCRGTKLMLNTISFFMQEF